MQCRPAASHQWRLAGLFLRVTLSIITRTAERSRITSFGQAKVNGLRSSIKIDQLREKARYHTIEAVAWVSGLSNRTISAFRCGFTPSADALGKIQEAVAVLKRGLSISTAPGPLHVDSGKPWQGRTTVKEITRGRRCGFCGGEHPDRFTC
jgi:hypothetical protein